MNKLFKTSKNIRNLALRFGVSQKFLKLYEYKVNDFFFLKKIKKKDLSRDKYFLYKRALKFGYFSWPKKINKFTHNLDVIDVGCGTGLHAIGYDFFGVKSYTGLDPKIQYDNCNGKNLRKRIYEDFKYSPKDIMKEIDTIHYISGTFEDIDPKNKFDIAVLHNVTEHLLNLEDVLYGISKILKTNGKILFNHHNFFCWNGHHKVPKTIYDIKKNDPIQKNYIDWKHLEIPYDKNSELFKKLNRISIDQLKKLTQKYFLIETWNEIKSTKEYGIERLTPEIIKRHDCYTKKELSIQHIFCIATIK
ncbi:hypothetical protein DSCW_09630 [Desulfosarcina widdelii]|uniref:Methyltransferase type 11 domain-containing protein n=2 Tax=Desulfosarcina widdelii TaxID=947919 RepID=A0A5K7YW47_9BACT|nr:hypothetical protein DSCW_09630 [Desulfosarcina widdelii]